jgi:glycosyltransferase involved in cell wall biosynthesis
LFGWLKEYPERKKYRIVLNTAFKSLPVNTLMKELYGIAEIVVVNSRFEEKTLMEVLPELNIKFIPHSINTQNLRSSGMLPPENSNHYGIACVAKDIPGIDFPALIKSWGIVAKTNKDAAFGIFAHPAHTTQWNLPDMLDVYGISKNTFVQFKPEENFGFNTMSDLYSSIDLIVLPHQEDMLNTIVLEAAYCGVPMITARGGATEEYIPDTAVILKNSDVFVAPPLNTRYRIFDAEEIAEKIINEMKRGKRRESSKFKLNDLKFVTDQWIAVI